MKKIIYFIFLILLLPACKDDFSYKIVAESGMFKKKDADIYIDLQNNTLRIKFKLELPENFPFPVYQNDTLCFTDFEYTFMKDGEILACAPFFNEKLFGKLAKKYKKMQFTDSAVNLSNGDYYCWLHIPLHTLYYLQQGKQHIEFYINATHFYHPESDTFNTKTKPADFQAAIGIGFNMPIIYESKINFDGLYTSQSSGMDVKIFKTGKADIFWRLYYPVPNDIYWESPVSKQAEGYYTPRLIKLYHYEPNPKIKILVLDYDYISRNDLLGRWKGKLGELRSDTAIELSFDKVDWFKIHAIPTGVINP